MVLAKAKENPLTELPLRKGVFCAFRPAKASPFGRGVTEGDGEGKPGTKEHLHSDKHWLLIESSYRCVFVLSQHPCPLSRACARQLPQRGSPWQAGQLPTGRLRPDMAQKGGRCYRGQPLLDNAPCQATAGLDSGALPFPRHCALLVQRGPARHASGSPFGGAGERSETERASLHESPRKRHGTTLP